MLIGSLSELLKANIADLTRKAGEGREGAKAGGGGGGGRGSDGPERIMSIQRSQVLSRVKSSLVHTTDAEEEGAEVCAAVSTWDGHDNQRLLKTNPMNEPEQLQ